MIALCKNMKNMQNENQENNMKLKKVQLGLWV